MSLSVLLVKHDERGLHALGRGLREAGFLVMPLGDADEAIDLLGLVSFDVVVVDAATLRYAHVRHANGLTALVRVLRGAPLLLFTATPALKPPGDNTILVLEHAVRDLPCLLRAIDQLLGDRLPLRERAAARGLVTQAPFDMGDVDDLVFPPLFLVDDDRPLRVESRVG